MSSCKNTRNVLGREVVEDVLHSCGVCSRCTAAGDRACVGAFPFGRWPSRLRSTQVSSKTSPRSPPHNLIPMIIEPSPIRPSRPIYANRSTMSTRRGRLNLLDLPDRLLLSILIKVSPHELFFSSRSISRRLYLASMHILRSLFLSSYTSCIRSPYSSDPLGMYSDITAPPYLGYSPSTSRTSSTLRISNSIPPSPASITADSSSDLSPPTYQAPATGRSEPVLPSRYRETKVLDLFISLYLYNSKASSESELLLVRSDHLPESEASDLFDLYQPRARLEDLVIERGVLEGLIEPPSSSGDAGPPLLEEFHRPAIRAKDVSVRFSLRKAAVLLPFLASSSSSSLSSRLPPRTLPKVVVELDRDRRDPLEATASKLLEVLRFVPVVREERNGQAWYNK